MSLVRVVGELIEKEGKRTRTHNLGNPDGEVVYVNLERVDFVHEYLNMEDGVDWNFGGCLYDDIMFQAGFCKNKEKHTRSWEEAYAQDKQCDPNQEDICNCEFMDPATPTYALDAFNGKRLLVHPEDSGLVQTWVQTKRAKN